MRTHQAYDWAAGILSQTGIQLTAMDWLPGDASFRRYARLTCADNAGEPLLLVDSPPALESITAVTAHRPRFADSGVRVPHIYSTDAERGFMLIEDFGDQLLYQLVLDGGNYGLWYRRALHALVQIQGGDTEGLAPYDQQLLSDELGLFGEWFVTRLLRQPLPHSLPDIEAMLIDNALQQPLVLTHRDYHSRNLLALADGELGIIDFQDAVLGPVSYDLVSLLQDSYLEWPPSQQQHWRSEYRQLATDADISGADDSRFEMWMDLMGAQRQLKILGIFSRLYLRDGKPCYLADILPTCKRLLATCARYQSLETLGNWLNRRLALVQQVVERALA